MHVLAFLKKLLNIIIQTERNQFNVNSIINYLSNIKNKQIKAVFAYFHNDSFKAPK